MKLLPYIILIFTIVVGTYLNSLDKDKEAQIMIEDSVGTSFAAPIHK